MATDQHTHDPADPLVALPEAFADARGAIQTLVGGWVQSVQVISSKAQAVRANHYHRTDSHFMYVIWGVMRYYHRVVGDGMDPAVVIVAAGQMVFTPPLVEHAVVFLEDSLLINITSKPRDKASYEDDLVRVSLIDPSLHGQ